METERIGNQRKLRNHLNHNIIYIGRNTPKKLYDMRKLVFKKTQVNAHQFTWAKKIVRNNGNYNNNKKSAESQHYVT